MASLILSLINESESVGIESVKIFYLYVSIDKKDWLYVWDVWKRIKYIRAFSVNCFWLF